MKNKILKSIFVVFMCSICLYANDFKVEALINKNLKDISFPYFSSKKYSKSARDINTILQYTYFRKTFIKEDFFNKDKNPFVIEKEESGMEYTFKYKIKEFTNYITLITNYQVCIEDVEKCFAPRKDYFIFDKYTGRILSIEDFFTKAGIKKLREKIIHSNLKTIDFHLNKHQKDKEYYRIYSNCKKRVKRDSKLDKKTAFYILGQKVVFEHERCTPDEYNPMLYDEIGKFSNSFNIKKINKYLTIEAKKYLSSKNYKLAKIKSSSRVYRGYIANKYPITLIHLVHNNYHYDQWAYWYDKYKKKITLKQVTSKEGIKLLELYYDIPTKKHYYPAQIILKEKKGALVGKYIRKKDLKTMNIFIK